jgi:hypothetical protein
LVELIIVIAILAVLAGILIPLGMGYLNDARKTACDSNVATDKRMVVYALISGEMSTSGNSLTAADVRKYLADRRCATKCADGKTDLDISIYEGDIVIFCPVHGKDDHAYMKNIITNMLSNQAVKDALKSLSKDEVQLDSKAYLQNGTFVKKMLDAMGLSLSQADVDSFTFAILGKKNASGELVPTTAYFIPDRTSYVGYEEFTQSMGYEVPPTSPSSGQSLEERKRDFKAYYAYKYEVDPETGRITTSRCFVETSSMTGKNSTIITDPKYIYSVS